uniref:Zinc finger protein 516 n=1 Tax=Neogobius melanostomus TaxID=47308 RepID=A0A8C6SLL3_9GOBI
VADNSRFSIELEKGPKRCLHELDGANEKGSFNCNVCGRSFPFLSSLSQHMRRHTGARPYKCPYCNHRASQKGNLKVHIRSHNLGTLSTHHSNEDEGAEEEEMSVSEGLDGGTSPTKSSSACNKMINGNGMEESRRKLPVRSLKREKSASDMRPFCCRLCGFEAQREDQLLSHIEKVHITADTEEDKEEALSEPDAAPSQDDGSFPCETCGQVFSQAWFLKSHMKTHNTKSRSRSRTDSAEHPATINDVAQDPESVSAVISVYQMCSKCGNLFHSKESLRVHDKVHSFSYGKKSHSQCRPCEHEDSPAAKRGLFDYLNLKPVEEKVQNEEEGGEEVPGQRIPELDPVCSYQAWQLATKGKVVEPVELCYKTSNVGGNNTEEALASAVVFEKESSRFVLQGQGKRGSGRRSSSGLGSHTSSGERTPESLSDSEYRPASRQDRKRASQSPAPSKTNECLECGKVFRSRHQLIVHQKVHSKDRGGRASGRKDNTLKQEPCGSNSDPESGSPSRPSTPGYGDSPPASALGQEASEMGSANAGKAGESDCFHSSLLVETFKNSHSVSSGLIELCAISGLPVSGNSPHPPYLRVNMLFASFSAEKTMALLFQEIPIKISVSNQTNAKHLYRVLKVVHKQFFNGNKPRCSNQILIFLMPVDLCVRTEGHRGKSTMALDRKNLPSHKCSFCSHSTRYPEVLWMHQTVAHRINSNSSNLAPKWAPRNTPKSSKENSLSWRRRTGPPPVLEGKECPPLIPLSRSKRTQPPNHSNESVKKSRPSSHSSEPSPSTVFSKKTFSSQSGKPPVRPHGDQSHQAYFKPKVDIYPRASSSLEKSKNSLLRSSHPSSSSIQAPRTNERYVVPQEGLGFMLSSKHALADYNRSRASHHQPVSSSHSQSRVNATRPSALTHSSTHSYPSTQVHGGAPQNPSSSTALNIFKSLMRQGQYFCHECGKSFSQPSHLRTHMRSHTGKQPSINTLSAPTSAASVRPHSKAKTYKTDLN